MAEEQLIRAMGLVRIISGVIEIAAAMLILRSWRMEQAFRINALLGLVGPTIFTVVTLLGLAGLAERLSLARAITVLAGVGLILSATR